MKRILVTGGAGFIGSNFVRMVLSEHPDCFVVNLDKLTYAGNLENLAEFLEHENHKFIKGDICDGALVEKIIDEHKIDAIINFAAESHVDRSIDAPRIFLETNTLGTQALLEVAADQQITRFVQISTDEVYGSLGAQGRFTESSRLQPNSPYAASKAAADLICRAYHQTFGLPVMITRCSNNYGPYQFPEKLIPLMIANALEQKPLPVYGDGQNVRDWIYVDDHCRAIDRVLRNGQPGEVYNIGGKSELPNIELVKTLLAQLEKPESLIEFVPDRLGHDRRYAIDASKIIKELDWQPSVNFAEGINRTIDWYLKSTDWLANVVSGDYQKYYDEQYLKR